MIFLRRSIKIKPQIRHYKPEIINRINSIKL